MTTTKTMRDHPDIEAVPKMSITALWEYVLSELEFLASPDQRRIPQSVEVGMRELHRRRHQRK